MVSTVHQLPLKQETETPTWKNPRLSLAISSRYKSVIGETWATALGQKFINLSFLILGVDGGFLLANSSLSLAGYLSFGKSA